MLEATPSEAQALVTDVSYTGPAIIDETGVLEPLALNYWPVLVLLDADGRIASLSHQVRDPAELDAMLDALLAGTPIPAPTWVAGPGSGDEASTSLEVGQPAPDWSVPTPDGGTLAVHDLLGSRAALYYGLPQGGDDFDAQNEAMLRDLDAARRTDPDLLVYVIDAQAATMDAARAALDVLPVDLPLVADRDGIVGSSWGLAYYPSLVLLDEAGRVAWVGAGPCADAEAVLQAFRESGPMPSPTTAFDGPACP